MNEVTPSTMSFDRMRTMLVRAAEIRESEQQQIFDTLDEMHSKLAALDSIGSIRKRVADLPDRTEISVLAERLDETVSKLEANDNAVAALTRSVDSIVDKLAKPFAQLDGRLDGVAGKFEGVAGRMDGLEDKLSNIHRRLDELEVHLDKQDNKTEALPREINGNIKDRFETFESSMQGKFNDLDSGVRETVNTMSRGLDETREELSSGLGDTREQLSTGLGDTREQLAAAKTELHERITSSTEELHGAVAETTDVLHGKLAENHAAATDPARFDPLNERIEQLSTAIESVSSRIDAVESDIGSRVTGLAGELRTEIAGVRDSVDSRPDAESVDSMVRNANSESEQRNAGQLDEAMATFAELILGGGASNTPSAPSLPTQQSSRRRSAKARTNGNGAAGHGNNGSDNGDKTPEDEPV